MSYDFHLPHFNKLSVKEKTIVIVVFVAMFLIFGTFIFRETVVSINSSEMEAENLSLVYASEIEIECMHTFQLNGIMAALLFAENDAFISDFQRFASHLLLGYPTVKCIQLAPDGIVSKIYPLEGNESAIGHNLFMDPNRYHEAVQTRNSGILTIGGPYELSQGGVGIIGRYPVFLDAEKSEFWGFINVVVTVPQIFDSIDFSAISKHGYKFSIYKVDENTGERVHIYGSEFDELHKPVCSQLDISNARWEIALAPVESWVDIRLLVVLIVFSVLIVLALTFVAILIIQQYMNTRMLAAIAINDQLTGLFSRQTAVQTLEKELKNALENGSQLAVCFIDMNDFKRINDTFGHTSGDAALKWVAKQLKSAVQPDDIVARFGGDEFIIIFRGQHSESYVAAVESIRQKINCKAELETGIVTDISAAVGLAMYPENGSSVKSLVQYADDEMYKNKAGMKGRSR